MPRVLDPFRFVLTAVGGWMNRHQLQIIDYLREENRVLGEQLGGRRVRLTDDQRRRLAAKAKGLGGIRGEKKAPLFRSVDNRRKLTANPMSRTDVLRMVKRRAQGAGLPSSCRCRKLRPG